MSGYRLMIVVQADAARGDGGVALTSQVVDYSTQDTADLIFNQLMDLKGVRVIKLYQPEDRYAIPG